MTDLLRVLLADDELVARKRARRLLEEIGGIEIAGECGNGLEVLERLAHEDVDVVLLDIRMPGLDGIETKKRIDDEGPYVIFTTAHAEHAVDAFDVGAVDYVLKPLDSTRLARALERARQRLAAPAIEQRPAERGTIDRLPITTQKGVRLIDPNDITHASFDGELVTIYVRKTPSGSEPILSDLTLAAIEERAPQLFDRVHRRALLNLRHVDRLEPKESGGYVAITSSGDRVEVARQAARALRRRLGLT
jgi:two-component system LytT family response regulator